MRAPRFWSSGSRGGAVAALLAPLGWAYGLGTAVRLAVGRRSSAGVPVICVGNVTAGGAGKTPVVRDLARRLLARGCKVHVLSRGYGGWVRDPHRVDPASDTAREVGDEPLMLAGDVPTWVGADRRALAKAAVEAGAEVLITDDGFQDPALEKTLSLLVVDGAAGLGNGRIIPAGPLREPWLAAIRRADAVCIVGDDETGIATRAGAVPVLRARIVARDADRFRGRRVYAFAGIGRPEKFFATLEAAGALVVDRETFADHHPYTTAEAAALIAEAARLNAVLATTEKDVPRLPAPLAHAAEVVTIGIAWEDEPSVARLLDRVCA